MQAPGWLGFAPASTHRFGSPVYPPSAFYQFRLAFERTQAKGSFKVMTDRLLKRLSPASGTHLGRSCLGDRSDSALSSQRDSSSFSPSNHSTFSFLTS